MERFREWWVWLRRVAPERLLLLLLVAITIALWTWALSIQPRPLEVVSFAVGDGDAFLIRAPSGRAVLLDGGSRSQQEVGERVLAPNLLLLGVRKLDAIIITHSDSDHVNGLPAIMSAIPVDMILDTGIPGDGSSYQQVLEWAKQDEIPRYTLRAGNRLNLDDDVHLDILAPADNALTGTDADDNNNSLVCMLTAGQARMLFTGDLQFEGEEALLAQEYDLHADILKVAHHGSRYSTSEAFLDAVNPYRAIVSSQGAESNGHPHPELLARLRNHGIQILRTDVNGQIRLTTDGKGWDVSTYRRALQEME